MSSRRIDELLEEVLAAYDTGLTPEECLSAFKERRTELEPLFRQALSLRMAYAVAPTEERRVATRERLLFAAGREVSQALNSEPDPEFVNTTRARLMNRAGASAQEALRNVPPPRLPFWMNARRRLLEAAASPAPKRAMQPMVIAMRAGLSAAVVVLAVGIASLLYLTSGGSGAKSANAEYAYLEEQTNVVAQQQAAGAFVSPSVLVELTKRTNDLAAKINDQPATPLSEKLPALIEKQKDVVNTATSAGPPPAELQQAAAQLKSAEQKVSIFAARAETPIVQQPTAVVPPAVSPTSVLPTPLPSATAATTLATTALLPGQVEIRLLPADNAFNEAWTQIRTTDIRFVVPSTWRISGLAVNAQGIAVLQQQVIRIDGPAGEFNVILLVYPTTGQISALLGNQVVVLRSEGPNGRVPTIPELVAVGGPYAPELSHLVDSIQVTGPFTPFLPPTATAPAATATPSPSATPSAKPNTTGTPSEKAQATNTPPPATPTP